MTYYVIVTSDPRTAKRVLRVLARNDSQIVAVAIVARTRKHVLGGVVKVGEVRIVKGYPLLLPAPRGSS